MKLTFREDFIKIYQTERGILILMILIHNDIGKMMLIMTIYQ